MRKKYELTKEVKIIENPNGTDTILYRIRALKPIRGCQKGELGGWVESEKNLSQRGTSWVSQDSIVCGNARVYGNASVVGDSSISGNAKVYGSAIITSSMVYGNAKVYGHACAYGKSQIYGNARVYEHATVLRESQVFGNARIHGHASIYIGACIHDSINVSGRTLITENAEFHGSICIKHTRDHVVVGPIGPEDKFVTFCKVGKEIYCFCDGCSEVIDGFPLLMGMVCRNSSTTCTDAFQFLYTIDFVKAYFRLLV